MNETAFTFTCRGAELVGLLHAPDAAAARGVLVVVGGPQYRVGSHRQFVLLARALAAAGVPVMRFDHRGLGDSEGDFRGFEHIQDDIDAAVDAFQRECPGLTKVVLWGLCDAASAILLYAHKDPRIAGIVLVNPWVRTEAGLAETHLRHYYGRHLRQGAFWRRLLAGQVDVLGAVRSFLANLGVAVAGRLGRSPGGEAGEGDLPARMAEGLARYQGPVLLILSGNDLTAREFEDAARESPAWRGLLDRPQVRQRRLDASDHTFSRQSWRDQVAAWTLDWLGSR